MMAARSSSDISSSHSVLLCLPRFLPAGLALRPFGNGRPMTFFGAAIGAAFSAAFGAAFGSSSATAPSKAALDAADRAADDVANGPHQDANPQHRVATQSFGDALVV